MIPLFWTSGDVPSGFESQSGQPYLHLGGVFFMRCTSGATPACRLMASMAASHCSPHAIPYRWIKFSTVTPSHYFNPFHDLGTLFIGGGGGELYH